MLPRSPLAVFSMVIGVFLVIAVHVGIADHSKHLMSSDGTAAVAMDTNPGMILADAQQTDVMDARHASTPAKPANDHQKSGGIGMTMICQLLVLATIVGALIRVLMAWWERWAMPRIVQRRAEAHVHPIVPPPRPPGLAVLCVARC